MATKKKDLNSVPGKFEDAVDNFLGVERPKEPSASDVANTGGSPTFDSQAGYKGNPNNQTNQQPNQTHNDTHVITTTISKQNPNAVNDQGQATGNFKSSSDGKYSTGDLNNPNAFNGQGIQISETPEQKAKNEEKRKLALQVGATNDIGADQEGINSNLDNTQGDVLQGAIKGAGVGAVGGAVSGGVVGGIVGGIAGALIGAVNAHYSSLKENYQEQTGAEYQTYKDTKKNINAVVDNLNQGGDPIEGVRVYNEQIMQIKQARANLEYLSRIEPASYAKNLNELRAINNFLINQKPLVDQKVQDAILAPNPTKTLSLPSDYGLEDLPQ